jgi:hypothetical protein
MKLETVEKMGGEVSTFSLGSIPAAKVELLEQWLTRVAALSKHTVNVLRLRHLYVYAHSAVCVCALRACAPGTCACARGWWPRVPEPRGSLSSFRL